MIRIDNPADLAETLGLLRRLGGFTQSAVGDELSTNASRIGDYERGRFTPNGSTLMRYLAALGYQLAIVPVIETSPETALSVSVAAETPSAGIRGGSEDSQALTEALRLLRLALHLRQHGERAPGGDETWTDWHRQAETMLRAADRPAGVVLVDDGTWEWHWTPTQTGSYSGPHGPDICPAIGCQHGADVTGTDQSPKEA